jgi:hypothetical protein
MSKMGAAGRDEPQPAVKAAIIMSTRRARSEFIDVILGQARGVCKGAAWLLQRKAPGGNAMDTQMIYAIFLGLGLAASTGLNTFLPMFLLAAAAHFKILDAHQLLGGNFAWVASGGALTALAIATVFEVVGDKIPAVDHFLDAIGTVARPVVGAFAAASVWNGDPATAALAGLIVGAPTALGFHAAKASTRAASSTTTMGVGNPILSTLEDIAAFIMTLAALLAPVLVPLLLLVFALVLWKLWRSAKSLRTQVSSSWPFRRGGSLST